MMYLHYWHFNKNWYAVLNSEPGSRKIYWHGEDDYILNNSWEAYRIHDAAFLTHREIKQLLTEAYPNVTLVKDIAYHEGRRWFGNKEGSRR